MAADELKIFISYSRRDYEAAGSLVETLEAEGFSVTIDRRDLPYGEEWQAELADFIRASDTVLWLVSPDSIGSRWVNWELGEVGRLSKRLVPLTIRTIVPEDLPESLGKINLLPSEGTYDPAVHFSLLVATLNTDQAWVKEGTRLLDRTREWKARGGSTSLLLRGPALKSAELWSARRPQTAPAPPGEVLELILESRKSAARRQRWTVGGSLAAALVGIGLAAFGGWQAYLAQKEAALATANEERAVKGEALAKDKTKVAEDQTKIAEDQTKVAEYQTKVATAQTVRANENEARALKGEALAKDNEKRAIDGEARAVKGEQQAREAQVKAQEQRDAALKTQSRFLADRARQAAAAGDYETAALLAIESFPDKASDVVRPYVADALEPLNLAMRNLHEGRVLQGEAQPVPDATFPALTGKFIEKIQVDDSGTTIAAKRNDETIRIWHADNGYEPTVIRDVGHVLYDYSLSPNGREVVTGSDGGLITWDTKTGAQLRKHADAYSVACLTYSPDGRAIAYAAHKYMKLIDSTTGRELKSTESNGRDACSSVTSLKELWFDRSGQHLISMVDKVGLLYNLGAGTMTVLSGHQGDVKAVAISGDGQLVATVADDGETRIWSVATSKPLATLKATKDELVDVSFDLTGDRILTASKDGIARLWDWKSEKLSLELKGHSDGLSGARFSADGKLILTTSFDKTAKVWNGDNGALITTLAGHAESVFSGAFSPSGRSVVTGGGDSTAREWTLPAEGPRTIAKHGGAINSAKFSFDGRTLITASEDGTAKLWNVSDGKLIRSFEGHTAPVMDAELCRVGHLAATASIDKTARIWTLDPKAPPLILTGIRGIVFSARFSDDCQLVATSSMDEKIVDHFTRFTQTIRVWDAKTGIQLREIQEDGQTPAHFAFSRDGHILATAFAATAELWDIKSGAKIKTFPRKNEMIDLIGFGSSGDRLLMGIGRTVVAWDIKDDTASDILHNGVVRGFNVDMTIAAGRDFAGLLDYKIWDLANDKEIDKLEGTKDGTGDVGFSTDGKFIAVPKKDDTVQIWPVALSGEELLAKAKSKLTRCLTPQQREQAFLAPEPPVWCITGEGRESEIDQATWQPKWPYATAEWQQWLVDARAGTKPTLPTDTTASRDLLPAQNSSNDK